MTQNDKVLQHISREGSISQLEAWNCLKISRLAARVNDLRGMGHPIVSTMVDTVNMAGSRVKVARYFLIK
ncbi:Helix-turn-helix domain containing protein [uncultured Caudovirales phage]|uniref:Helix-turn-helix domain containing protein n=1 Tax=uncultured Caudovirales phage TaxID=2100421 RepID=A0A6J7WA50_9CAUD|nr:Helix-turn-helix domain containing protein [uncultured Caudovirales phage]